MQSLGWEDPLEKGKATHSIFWPGEFHGQRSLQAMAHGVAKRRTQLSDFHFSKLRSQETSGNNRTSQSSQWSFNRYKRNLRNCSTIHRDKSS